MDAVLFPLPCASSSLLACAHNSSKHLPSSPSSGVGLPPLPHRPLRCRASLRREISPAQRESSISPLPRRSFGTRATAPFSDDLEVLPVSSNDPTDQQQGSSLLVGMESEENSPMGGSLSGFSPDPPFTFDLSTAAATGGVTAAGSSSSVGNDIQVLAAAAQIEADRLLADRAVNALIVGAAGAFAVAKILTVDHDYWHGWTLFEILKYAPLHNWSAYEEALKSNPVLAKMMISGIVYSVGDWIAQCYEGKPVLDFSRERMIRSGLVGFCLHGSLSHYYYHFCEAIFPFKDWWVVPLKVAFDQTIWSGFWNSVYFVVLGLLRFESPVTIAAELRSTFWPLLTAGWKLWPFAHLVTYGLIPVEQRLLWVDCVELVWVTILSMYSNEKAEARILEAANELNGNESATVVLPPMDVNAEGNAEVVE